MFAVGDVCLTLGGKVVTIVSIHSPGTSYECVKGDDNIARYNTRDYGRCTGSDHECPRDDNLEIPADKRHLITYIKEKKAWSMERALNCFTCTSDFLRNMRDPQGRVIIRCLSCGTKSVPEDNTWNAVNRWNKQEYQ